jgi:hypothetical protein
VQAHDMVPAASASPNLPPESQFPFMRGSLRMCPDLTNIFLQRGPVPPRKRSLDGVSVMALFQPSPDFELCFPQWEGSTERAAV